MTVRIYQPESGLDVAQVTKAVSVLFHPDEPHVIFGRPAARARMARAKNPKGLVAAVTELATGSGCYYSLNPVRPDLGDRMPNVSDITRRHNLLINVAAVRANTDLMATQAERDHAMALMYRVRDHLSALGWPLPVVIDGGNGGHLIYRVSQPADDHVRGVISKVLKHLKATFDTPEATIDKSVPDATGIAKLPGTLVRKGADTAERPWRMATLLFVPDPVEVVTLLQLEALLSPTPAPAPAPVAVPEPRDMTVHEGPGPATGEATAPCASQQPESAHPSNGDCRAAALAELDAGRWPVVLRPIGEVRPDGEISEGKDPFEKAWGARLRSRAEIERLFDEDPRRGVGRCLGPGRGPDGSWLMNLEGDGDGAEDSKLAIFDGAIVATLGHRSARGGHGFYTVDGDRLLDLLQAAGAVEGKGVKRGVWKLEALPGLEWRVGGLDARGVVKQVQTAIPPTIGTDGLPREWNGIETIAELPESVYLFLEALADFRREREAIQVEGRPSPDPDAWKPPTTARAGTRDRARASAFGAKILSEETARMAAAVKGQRHLDALPCTMRIASAVKSGLIDESQCRAEMTRVLKDIGLPDSEIRDLIESALAKAQPRTNLPDFGSSAQQAAAPSVVTPIDEDSIPIDTAPWPKPPDPRVYRGIPGQIVRAIQPHTEADPLAILGHLLLMFGNGLGRTAYIPVGATRHYLNEFAVFVGKSAIARKGMAGDWATHVLDLADGPWVKHNIISGLSSGEGLISAVKDPVEGRFAIRQKGRIVGWQTEIVDVGVVDKRKFFLETEFGGVLRALQREGNKLAAVMRQAWDNGNLRSTTKTPLSATNAHITICGHITAAELLLLLQDVDFANGLANRFWWFAVKRVGSIAFPGTVPGLEPLAKTLGQRIASGRNVAGLQWDAAAKALWQPGMYESLMNLPPSRLSDLLSRGAPHVLRIACIYCLADGKSSLGVDHLEAAKALWDCSAGCIQYIFGQSLGDPVAERILVALKPLAPQGRGLTRTELHAVLQRHVTLARIKQALSLLIAEGQVGQTEHKTPGRTAWVYSYTGTP
jgi:hypothetical protein